MLQLGQLYNKESHNSSKLESFKWVGLAVGLLLILICFLNWWFGSKKTDGPKRRFCDDCILANCCDSCLIRTKSEKDIEKKEYDVYKNGSLNLNLASTI